MYNKLNITENHLKVLILFSNDYDSEYYIREIQKKLGLSPRTVQLVLQSLEEKGVLESEVKGKIRSYRLRKGEIAKDYLVLTEQYKKITFLGEHEMIREIIEKISKHIEGIGVIFGSYAKGREKKDSDLDVFIAGKYNSKKIKEVSKMYGIDVNVKNYKKEFFEKNKEKDILLEEVIDNHILFLNGEEFVRVVFDSG